MYGLAGPQLPRSLPGGLIAPAGPTPARAVALVLGLALLAVIPGVWRGTRMALALAILALLALAALGLAAHQDLVAAVRAGLGLALGLSRGGFRLGCRNRPRLGIAAATLSAWGLVAVALALAPLVGGTAGHVLVHVLRHPIGHGLASRPSHLSAGWDALLEILVAAAVAASVLALRSLVSPVRAENRHSEHEYRAARAVIDAHGADSLAPFIVRPDKALAFAAGGVLSYRVIKGMAVISADPVAPSGEAGAVLAGFAQHAHRQGWQIALWGASARHLGAYRALGLRALRVGEEAFVDPSAFTLEGRAVRKLRQSVHRVRRRGWEILALDGRDIDAALEVEIDALAARWRRDHPRLHGFAMGMGEYSGELRPDDLHLLARSPEGELRAAMRFAVYGGNNLSLDTMQRVGETPNGLNEALVVRAIEIARERGVHEVSLNYAGLAHLVRRNPSRSPLRRRLTAGAMAPLHRRFQLDRLVRFNEKFSPEWRPRYLVYESRLGLPRAILRVLQAEGYLPQPRPPALFAPRPRQRLPRGRHPGALGEPR